MADIAYLVVAHNYPEQLARLLAALNAPGVRFFVHVDGKAALPPFVNAVRRDLPVTWMRQRIAVNWGGFSQLEASLRLAHRALEVSPGTRRLFLLSGSCYPTVSNAVLARTADSPLQYIGARRLRPKDKNYRRIAAPVLNDHPLLNVRGSGADERLRRSLRQYVKRFVAEAFPATELQIPYYKGLSWWSLTADAVRLVIETALTRQDLLNRFRYSGHPDESFVQTVLLNSEFARQVAPPLHYMDWSSESRKQGKYLDERAMDRLQPQHWFVRKVNPTVSARLLELLDARRAEPATLAPPPGAPVVMDDAADRGALTSDRRMR